MNKLVSTNPSKNYQILGEVNVSTQEEIIDKVKNANFAKLVWKELGVKGRVEKLKVLYDKLTGKKKSSPCWVLGRWGCQLPRVWTTLTMV